MSRAYFIGGTFSGPWPDPEDSERIAALFLFDLLFSRQLHFCVLCVLSSSVHSFIDF